MWIGSFPCLSFKLQMFEALHDFRADTFKLALYSESAILTDAVEAYQAYGEIPAFGGYVAGGKTLLAYPPVLVNKTAVVTFDEVVWPDANFSARGALAYNATKPGWPALFALDFGVLRTANNGPFRVRFPGTALQIS